MIKKGMLAVAICFLSGCTQNEPKALLWKDLPVGSSADYVLQQLPDAIKAHDTDCGGGDNALAKSGIKISGVDFKAIMSFSQNGLSSVCLYPDNENHLVPNDGVLDDIKYALIAKHGAPIEEIIDNKYGINYQGTWRAPENVLIKLWYVRSSLPEDKGSLGFYYYVPENTGGI